MSLCLVNLYVWRVFMSCASLSLACRYVFSPILLMKKKNLNNLHI